MHLSKSVEERGMARLEGGGLLLEVKGSGIDLYELMVGVEGREGEVRRMISWLLAEIGFLLLHQ